MLSVTKTILDPPMAQVLKPFAAPPGKRAATDVVATVA